MSHVTDATKHITVCVDKLNSDMSISHAGEHITMQGVCLQMIVTQLAGIRDALEVVAEALLPDVKEYKPQSWD